MSVDSNVSGFRSIELRVIPSATSTQGDKNKADQEITLTSLEGGDVGLSPEERSALKSECDRLLSERSAMARSHKKMSILGVIFKGFLGCLGALCLGVGALLNVVFRLGYAVAIVAGGAAGGVLGVGIGIVLALTVGVGKGIYERVTDKTGTVELRSQIWANMKNFVAQPTMIGAGLGATICADVVLFIPTKISEVLVEVGTEMMESPNWLDKGKSRAIMDWVGQVPDTPMREPLWQFLQMLA